MIDGLGTIAYLEGRRLAHRIAAIRKSPARAVMWTTWALGIGFFLWTRAHFRGSSNLFSFTNPHIATAIAGVYLAMLGLVSIGSRRGSSAAFESLAEARFVAMSQLSPILVAVWLQLRTSLLLLLQVVASLAFLFVSFSPGGNAGATLRYVGAALIASYVFASLPFPLALASRRTLRFFQVLGFVSMAVGIYAILREVALFLFADTQAAGMLQALPGVPIGTVFSDLARGGWLAFLGFALAGISCTLFTARIARDAYPELYEMTAAGAARATIRRGGAVAALARAQERSEQRFAKGRTFVTTRSYGTIPTGAWVLVWRGWVSFRRSRSLGRSIAGLLAWYVAGAAIGLAYLAVPHEMRPAFWAGGGGITMLFVLGAAFLGQTVALDLQKPLFWLAGTSTFARLTALIASGLWRSTLTIGGFFVAFFLVLGAPTLAAAAPFAAVALLVLLQTTGFALYALFPAKIDQAGPLAFVRVFAAYVSFAVPAFAALALGTILPLAAHVAIPSFVVALAAALTAGVEAALFLLFASARIDRTLDAFTRAQI